MPYPKRQLKQPPSAIRTAQSNRDAAIAQLIAGLNQLLAQSREAGLGSAARILSTAKEDMVHWAVDMNFHESSRDRFVNDQLFGPFGNGIPGAPVERSVVRHSTRRKDSHGS